MTPFHGISDHVMYPELNRARKRHCVRHEGMVNLLKAFIKLAFDKLIRTGWLRFGRLPSFLTHTS